MIFGLEGPKNQVPDYCWGVLYSMQINFFFSATQKLSFILNILTKMTCCLLLSMGMKKDVHIVQSSLNVTNYFRFQIIVLMTTVISFVL